MKCEVIPPHTWAFHRLCQQPPPVTADCVHALFEEYLQNPPERRIGPANQAWNTSPLFATICIDAYHRFQERLAIELASTGMKSVDVQLNYLEQSATRDWGTGSHNCLLDRGYLYIAFQPLFLQEAVISARSLREVDPRAHITVITDQEQVATGCFDLILRRPRLGWGRNKPEYMDQTPYRRTLFIDTDTWFCKSLRPLFNVLAHYDLAIAPCRGSAGRGALEPVCESMPPNLLLECGYEFNTGVMAFRSSEAIGKLFTKWKSYYQTVVQARYDGHLQPRLGYIPTPNDQRYFTTAIAENPVRLHVLERHWHVRFRQSQYLVGPVNLIHGRFPGTERSRPDIPLADDIPDHYRSTANEINQNSEEYRWWNGKRVCPVKS